ncbi:MAG: hypothetical protein ACKVU1_01680 [bacterium]
MSAFHFRRRSARRAVVAYLAFSTLTFVAPLAGFAAENAATPKPRKKVQEVDLHRLEIQGRLDNPASVFLLEKGATPLSDLWTLDGLLCVNWLTHVDKETLDRGAVDAVFDGRAASSAAQSVEEPHSAAAAP